MIAYIFGKKMIVYVTKIQTSKLIIMNQVTYIIHSLFCIELLKTPDSTHIL